MCFRYVFDCWRQVRFLTRSSSVCFSCLLTGVAALLAQGTCPPLSGPIFDSALLMTYCLIMQLQVSEILSFETENILILGSIYSIVSLWPI